MSPDKRIKTDKLEGKLQVRVDTAIAHINYKVGRPFRVIKQKFVFQKERLYGLAKNRYKLYLLTRISKLYLASGYLLAKA